MMERFRRLWLLIFLPFGCVIYFLGALVWGIPYWIWTGSEEVPVPRWFRWLMGET